MDSETSSNSDFLDVSEVFDDTDSDPDYTPNLNQQTGRPKLNIPLTRRGPNFIENAGNVVNLIPIDSRPSTSSNSVTNSTTANLIDVQNNISTDETDSEIRGMPKKPRGRKRPRNTENWLRNRETKKRLSGQQYKTRLGKPVGAKIFSDKPCNCARGCNAKISCSDREATFKAFYSLGDQTRQNLYLRGCIKTAAINRHRPVNMSKSPRERSFSFFIRLKNNDIRVCKKYFRETYQISDGRIYNNCLKDDVSLVLDSRGHQTPGNKVDVTDVINHIKSFPAYKSHYTRTHNPGRKYLNSNLTIKKMIDMYKSWCSDNGKVPVKDKQYYHVFSSQFNLHFKPPGKDTCQYCDSFENRLLKSNEEEKRAIECERELHLRKAEKARQSLTDDKNKCSEDYYVFTFDLQKALAFPKLSTSVAYYKRNLYVYNFGCHVLNNEKAFMYVWPETEGSRGSQEIAACLKRHITENAKNVKHIVTFSDSCTGQNRNIKVVLSLMKLLQSGEICAEVIELKYLVSGHSYLPNDSDFALIEKKAKKTTNIFSPRDWYNIILESKNKNKFFLVEMNHDEFLSTESLEQSITRRKKMKIKIVSTGYR